MYLYEYINKYVFLYFLPKLRELLNSHIDSHIRFVKYIFAAALSTGASTYRSENYRYLALFIAILSEVFTRDNPREGPGEKEKEERERVSLLKSDVRAGTISVLYRAE